MRLPCILTIAALLRASGQPRNATTAQARRRLQGGGVTAVVITVHNALASTIDCLEALVATARPSEGGAALDLLRGKGDILAFQAWLQGVLEAVRASGVSLAGPPEP